jgi:uncharacterized protein (TIGR00369 family)
MSLAALDELNRAIRANQVAEVTRVLGREPGMCAVELARGTSRWRWAPQDERARNPFGLVWGGYLAVFVDALLSSAIGGVLEPGELATTADLRLEFLRPAKFAAMNGEGRVVQKGGRVAFVEATISAEQGEALVRATSTWTVLRA